MKLSTRYNLDLGNQKHLYAQLLQEEDFDFKTKDVKVTILEEDSSLIIDVEANSLLELKIGTSAVMKSLEIISKTLEIK